MAESGSSRDPRKDLESFLAPFGTMLRRTENRQALESYVSGLLSEAPKKTASGLAEVLPGTNAQRLQEFLTRTVWDSRSLGLARVRQMRREATAGEGVQVLGDFSIPKTRPHSVGVARQCAEERVAPTLCQVFPISYYVDGAFDWPILSELYLPPDWTEDAERRERGGIPDGVAYRARSRIALDLFRDGLELDVPTRAVVVGSSYASSADVRRELASRRMPFVLHVDPAAYGAFSGRDDPVAWAELTAPVAPRCWRSVGWRERGGDSAPIVREVALLQGYRDEAGECEGQLLGVRTARGASAPPALLFACGMDDWSPEEVVRTAYLYQALQRFRSEAKQELGLADYEGRLWTGITRHVALVLLAHCYRALRERRA